MKLIRYNTPDSGYGDWDSFFADPFRAFAPLFRSTVSSAYQRPQNFVEWFEDDDHYYARVEIPGVKREDLSVDAEDGLVRFAFEKNDERFEQVLRCPEGIDVTKVGARLADGVLELTLPKAAEKKPVRVEIH